MNIRAEVVGRTAGHAAQGPRDVVAYTLDAGDRLSATVWTLGATLAAVVVPDRGGTAGNVVLQPPPPAAWEDREHFKYIGCTLGRYGRCVAGARFALDGVEHRLDKNAPPHHIHGGSHGFDRFVWEAEAERASDRLVLRLRLERPDGDMGYPGAVSAETTYSVGPDGRLGFEHRAVTDAPTIVAMTNHAYWNLAGGGPVDGHQLTIGARSVLLVDEDLLPVGDPVAVAGTPFDYTAPRRLGSHRLDHCFALDGALPGGAAPAVRLHDPASGRSMLVTTDQPGLQVYSGDGLPEPRSGICLQTGAWPDSPNRGGYPPARLDPGETYTHVTTHVLTTEE